MSKLFRIWYSDSNNRSEYARAKANDIEEVIEWLQKDFFKPEALEILNIDINSDTQAFIDWQEEPEEDQELTEEELDAYDGGITYSLEIVEIEEPEPEDFEFKTIYGTNDYYDLTGAEPVKAPDWDKELSEAWKRNAQEGCNLLTKKTLEAIAKGENLGEKQ